MKTKDWVKIIIAVLTAVAATLGAIFGLSSCSVTRNYVTDSKYIQRGDTMVTIVTKTTESYVGTRDSK